MKILIATTRIPFVRGGAELHALSLQRELRKCGHEAEIVAIPFTWYPPERILDHMLACRLTDLTEASGNVVDRVEVSGIRYPASEQGTLDIAPAPARAEARAAHQGRTTQCRTPW